MKENRPTKLESDRISALPDPILIKILSFLPTEQFIETSTVAKRWRNLWLSATSLIFHFNGIDARAWCYFIDFVATTLMLHSAPKLDRFVVSVNSKWNCRINSSTTVTTWLRYATMKHVQEIHLHLAGVKYRLPQQLYENDRVRVLSFKGCEILLPIKGGGVRWPSLEMLTITDCGRNTETMIGQILKRCPKIVCLDVIRADDFVSKRMVDFHYKFIRVKSN